MVALVALGRLNVGLRSLGLGGLWLHVCPMGRLGVVLQSLGSGRLCLRPRLWGVKV